MGVGAVLQGADDDRSRSARCRLLGGRRPARARPPARSYGAPRRPGRGRDARARRAAAAGPALERADRRHGARAAARWRDRGRRLGDSDRRPRRLRRAADRPRAALRRRPRRGCAARAGRARCVVRHQRLQPPARLRRRAPARQHRLDRARGRKSPGRRAAQPVPRRQNRRADRCARGRRGGLGPPGLAGLCSVTERAALRGARRRRRRRGWPTRALASHLSTWASRRRAARRPRSLCCDGPGRVDRVAVNGRQFAVRDRWNRLPPVCAACARWACKSAAVVQPPTGEGRAGGITSCAFPACRRPRRCVRRCSSSMRLRA